MKPDSDTIRVFFIYAVMGFLVVVIFCINILFSPKMITKIEIPIADEMGRRIVELEKNSHPEHTHVSDEHRHAPDHRHELIAEHKKWGRK